MVFSFVDDFLNKITMYRLTLYVLFLMLFIGIVLSFLGFLPHSGLLLILTAFVLLVACHFSNLFFSFLFKAPTNVESVYITALILSLVVAPLANIKDVSYLLFLLVISAVAMGSKYLLAIKKKHVFNPTAIAFVLSAFVLGHGASWWVGSTIMLPFVALGGLLMVRKIQHFDLVFSFLGATLITNVIMSGSFSWNSLSGTIFSPILFFALVMLTEPLTSPPRRIERISYGILVGFLASPYLHFSGIYSTPELALVLGNIFSYIISPKQKLILTFKEKVRLAENTYDFVFAPSESLHFKPGQYLEWTLPHAVPDTRGNRRYFTIASSPTESDIRLGVRFYPNGSSFKNTLLALPPGFRIGAGALAGEFTIPTDTKKKLIFLAGGIGITPFRSIIKFLEDKGEKRDIVLLYSNRTEEDIAYKEFLEDAAKKIGLKTIHVLSDEPLNTNWTGRRGLVNKDLLKEVVPDFSERYFYISGTHGMVVAFEHMLKELGIPKSRIKKDFFPGYV